MTITIILFILLILLVLIRLYKHIKADKIKDKDNDTHTGGIRVFDPGEWNNEFTKADEDKWQ